jgi:hypothetical protein
VTGHFQPRHLIEGAAAFHQKAATPAVRLRAIEGGKRSLLGQGGTLQTFFLAVLLFASDDSIVQLFSTRALDSEQCWEP